MKYSHKPFVGSVTSQDGQRKGDNVMSRKDS